MLQSILVPETILVKDEQLAALCVFEAQIWIEHVDLPHKETHTFRAFDLFEAPNVDDVALHFSKHTCFMQDDLLSVGKQLCMPAEMLHHSDLAWHLGTIKESGQKEDKTLA